MKMRQKLFRSGQFHSWLVVSLSLLFIVGEPAILRAGPCEQNCENTKTKDLAACDTVFNADEAKCILAARTAETICVNNEEQAFKNAEFVRDAAMNIALVTYVIAYGGCFYTLNLPCLYGINVAYAVALAGIPINYAREVKIAQKTAETCSSNWAATLTNCRKAADIDRAKCIKIANDNCARCKNNCGGDNGGG
jgi:hypothetical protein